MRTTMKAALSLSVLTACMAVVAPVAGAENSSAVFESARVELSADEQPQYVRASLRAAAQLKNVSFRFDDEPWQPTVVDADQDVAYTMKHARAAFAGRRVLAKAQDPETEKWIVISGEIDAEDDFNEKERKIVDEDEISKTMTGVLSENAEGLNGYPGEFLGMVNSYRARMGRGPLSYDRSLEAIAARNNQVGGYHNYTGGTPQIWAMGSSSVSGTLRQWQNSPPHNSILLGGYSRVGIAHDGRNWTANFR
jgi:hypothetical protein